MFLRIPLGLGLLYQQTEAEKDLPLGGAVVIPDFKSLPSALETANGAGGTTPAHQVLPPRQKLPALAHKTVTEQARKNNSTFCKTEVRLLAIKIICHLCSSPGQSKASFETMLSETSVKK